MPRWPFARAARRVTRDSRAARIARPRTCRRAARARARPRLASRPRLVALHLVVQRARPQCANAPTPLRPTSVAVPGRAATLGTHTAPQCGAVPLPVRARGTCFFKSLTVYYLHIESFPFKCVSRETTSVKGFKSTKSTCVRLDIGAHSLDIVFAVTHQ